MVNRLLGLLLAACALAGCATAQLSQRDAIESTETALDRAGITADDVAVTDSVPDAFTISANTSSGELVLVMDAAAGRFTSVELPEDLSVSEEQLGRLARHQSNPADDRARTRRTVLVAALVVALAAGGLGLARRARLREEELPH